MVNTKGTVNGSLTIESEPGAVNVSTTTKKQASRKPMVNGDGGV